MSNDPKAKDTQQTAWERQFVVREAARAIVRARGMNPEEKLSPEFGGGKAWELETRAAKAVLDFAFAYAATTVNNAVASKCCGNGSDSQGCCGDPDIEALPLEQISARLTILRPSEM